MAGGRQSKFDDGSERPPTHAPVAAGLSAVAAGSFASRVRLFLELIRFSHTLFALPFALLSAAMAWAARREVWLRHDLLQSAPIAPASAPFAPPDWYRAPRVSEVLGILLCMVFARSAAMAFNRLVDARFDAENPRTARRHLPAGLLSRGSVTCFTLVCAAGFVAATLLFLPNRWPLYLSVPVLSFLCGYSLTKRFTSWAHFWLGASLMLAPVAAWIAIWGDEAWRRPWPPLVLGGAVLLWVAGFDIIYATQDAEVDRKLRLRSVPARFGVAGALRIAALCHLGTSGLLFALPSAFPAFGSAWYAGVAGVAALLIYEHALVRPDDLTRVNTAFFQCNAVVSLGLLVVGAIDLLI